MSFSPDEEDRRHRHRPARSLAALAALGLVAVTGMAVAALCYVLVIADPGNAQVLSQLGTLATLGVGALVALAGAKRDE